MWLKKDQRNHIADKFMDTANIIFASLVVGGIINSNIGSIKSFLGFALYISIFLGTIKLKKKKDV